MKNKNLSTRITALILLAIGILLMTGLFVTGIIPNFIGGFLLAIGIVLLSSSFSKKKQS